MTQHNLDQMTAAMQLLAENVEGSVQNARKARGVAESYRETYPVLLQYSCQVATVEKLAPL